MPPRSRLSIAKPDIIKAFDEAPTRIFTRSEIEDLLSENRQYWRLAQATTTNKFIEFLITSTKLELHKFKLPHRPTNRYSWGEVGTLELVQSLRPDGYFTHFTALLLHELTEQIPKTIYLNFEQQATGGGGQLSQANIDRAFKNKCRTSNNITTFREQRLCVLNGQNTGKLGVIARGRKNLTDVERTLIDIAVRPIYSGGVHEVARAYASAKGNFSVNKLVAYLRRLNHTYPYHQIVGYYLERAGVYSETQLDLLRQFTIEFDFYLAHQMKETEYVEQWKLFVPKGF